MKRFLGIVTLGLLLLPLLSLNLPKLEANDDTPTAANIFDDRQLLNGYIDRYANESKDFLLGMIKDDNLDGIKMAAAISVFKDRFCREMFPREKISVEKILLRRLNRNTSPFVQTEIMHTLCRLDRYKYFDAMVPALILKMDHYNPAINEIAYQGMDDIIKTGNNRAREARIIFNALRKMLFLSRKRLANVTEPSPKLKQKLELVRWAIKVLGTQEIRKLPKEVINLL